MNVTAVIAVALIAVLSVLTLFLAARWPLPAALDAWIDVESMRSAFVTQDPDAVLKDLFDAERQRVITAAKGLAGSGAGLVAAIVPPVLQHGLGITAAPYVVIVLAGAALVVMLAARAALSARQLGDELVFAYALRPLLEGVRILG